MIRAIALIAAVTMLTVPAMAHETCPAIGDPVIMGNGYANETKTISASDHFLCEQLIAQKKQQDYEALRTMMYYPYYPIRLGYTGPFYTDYPKSFKKSNRHRLNRNPRSRRATSPRRSRALRAQ